MTQPSGQYDGGIDEQDRDQTEVQLALAVATLLAAKAATAPWGALVTARLSGMLRAYLQRSALDMARSAGMDTGAAAQAASDAVSGVMGDVEAHTAAWLRKAAEDRAPAGGGPMSQDQAREAAGIIARSLATYAREKVREHIATQLGALYKRWQTRLDNRVRPGHVALQGKTRRIGRPFVTEGHDIRYPGDPRAPLHLIAGCRCVPGWTRVRPRGNLRAIARFWWTGGLVEVRLRSGRVLTATPNHPVLTERGWIALSQCYPGLDLLTVEDERLPAAWHPHVEHPVPPVSDLFHAVARVRDARRVAADRFDFHGDMPDEDVDVVWTDWGLMVSGPAVLDEERQQGHLEPADAPVAGQRLIQRPVGVDVRESVRGGVATRFDAVAQQSFTDGAAGEAESGSDRVLALPALVGGDDRRVIGGQERMTLAAQRQSGVADVAVDVPGRDAMFMGDVGDTIASRPCGQDSVTAVTRMPRWSGHVYSPHTDTGTYTDDSRLVSRNCHLAYSKTPPGKRSR